MAFYFLNRLDKSISKQTLEKEFKKFGNLKFIGNIQEDKRDPSKNSTIAVFNSVDDTTKLEDYCKENRIYLQEKKDTNTQQNTNQDAKKQQNTSIQNPSFYFYKDEAYGKSIEEFKLTNTYENLFNIKDSISFELTTTYPGLLVGSGYNHPKLKENDDDFQLGFFFDHTTGLPLISGSSIKGVLRSICEHKEFVKDVYATEITTELFEDGSVIFYDAFIVKAKDNKIFGSDYITSHTDGELKNPNPIKFLKILPEVTFRFQFGFKDKNSKYLKLFEDIIKDIGLGAKTNTGYGKFK